MSPGTTDTAFPFLTLLVLLPAGAALVAAFVPISLGAARQRLVVELIAATSMLATLALSITIAVRFHTNDGGFQMVSNHSWTGQLGIGWHLGVDGISLFLILMSAVLFPIALAGARVRRDPRSFVVWMLVLEAACLGSFVSLDLVLFFLFFELTLVPIYFVIAGWGFERRSAAAVKFFLYTFLGSAFLLVGIVVLAVLHDQQTGKLTFDLVALSSTHLSLTAQILLFLSFTAAFAVKAPVFPLHTWSPDAYAQAPTGGSVVLAAVMAKLGTYGIIRFDLTLFPRAVVDLAPLLLTLGVIGILYGAIVACAQRDLKRLIAYSSLAHLGFIVLGTFALTTQALSGSVLQMVNHGLVTAALFILIGWIYERRRSWQTSELRGLQRPAPVLAAVFTLAMMASLGLPGLNGFVGEFLILSGTFLTHRWWAVVATVGVVLSAMYLLWAYQQAFHHKPDEANANTRDLNWREGIVMVPLVGLIIFLGVYPQPVLARISPSVNALLNRLDTETGKHQPVPGATTGGSTGASAIPAPGSGERYSGTGIAYALGVSVRDLALDSNAAALSLEQGVSKATLTAAASSELKVTGISGSALSPPAAPPAASPGFGAMSFGAMSFGAMRGER
jgi:NADH-quinone oxidoreductase subunit M